MNLKELKKKSPAELLTMAEELGVDPAYPGSDLFHPEATVEK